MSTLIVTAVIVGIVVLMPSVMLLPSILCYFTVKKKSNVVLLSAMFALLWGIAGYFFMNPMTDPDLVRYLQILEEYSDKSLLESFNLVYSHLYAIDVYFFLISKLGDPQLLPAISVFIFYFIVLYILADYKIRNNLNNKHFILFVLFVLSSINFCSIVNGIRWPLAFVCFFLAFYRENVQEKRNYLTIFLYIVSILMHFATLVFVILRLALLIKNRKIVLILGTSIALVPQVMNILSGMLSGISTPIAAINQIIYFIQRGNMYFQWGEGEWADIVRKSTYYKIESWYYYAVVALFSVVLFSMFRYRIDTNDFRMRIKWNNKELFVFYMLIVTILSFTMSAHTYIRFVIPLIVCFCIVNFQVEKMNRKLSFLVNCAMVLFTFFGILLNIYLLRSMIDLREYFANIVTSGVLKIILEMFIG